MSCVFCDIIAGRLPADVVYETEEVLVFRDINPCATHHLLVVPKEHVETVMDVQTPDLWPALMAAVQQVAEREGFRAFRLEVNSGAEAGQTVPHLHVHLLSGEYFDHPL